VASQQQAEWGEELKRLRLMMENVSQQIANGEGVADTVPLVPDAPVPTAELKAVEYQAEAEGAADANADPALNSVMAQFEMLQRDLARRRAAGA